MVKEEIMMKSDEDSGIKRIQIKNKSLFEITESGKYVRMRFRDNQTQNILTMDKDFFEYMFEKINLFRRRLTAKECMRKIHRKKKDKGLIKDGKTEHR